MSTFLFVAGRGAAPADAMLTRALATTRRVMPSFGVEMAVARTTLAEVDGGWWSIVPRADQGTPEAQISEHVTAELAVLAFGELALVRGVATAAHIAAVWRRGGLAAVRELDGSFGAVIVDRLRRQVWCATDCVGRRYLRSCQSAGMLLVSPHDIPLIATGVLGAPVLDPLVAAGMVVYKNTIHNRSLVRGIETISPLETVRWHAGVLERRFAPVLTTVGRPDAADHRGVARHLERMLEEMREEARLRIDAADAVHLDLTAGIDTRAVLGLMLSLGMKDRLRAATLGEPGSQDVRVARALAQACGLTWRHEVPELAVSPDDFLTHCDLRAFFMNGDTSSKRAMGPPPTYPDARRVQVGGRSGPTCRSWQYESEDQWTWPTSVSREAGMAPFYARFHDECGRYPWADAAFPLHVRAALREIDRPYQPISGNGHDLLYLTHLYERERGWGGMPGRLPWLRDRWSPIETTRLIRNVFRLPPPIGRTCRVHEILVRRHLGFAYWWRVNGRTPLALLRRRGPWALLRELDGRAQRRRRARAVLEQKRPGFRGVEELRAQALAGPWAAPFREILQAEGSQTRTLFGRAGIDTLLRQHHAGAANHLDRLGILVTLERWHGLVRAAS